MENPRSYSAKISGLKFEDVKVLRAAAGQHWAQARSPPSSPAAPPHELGTGPHAVTCNPRSDLSILLSWYTRIIVCLECLVLIWYWPTISSRSTVDGWWMDRMETVGLPGQEVGTMELVPGSERGCGYPMVHSTTAPQHHSTNSRRQMWRGAEQWAVGCYLQLQCLMYPSPFTRSPGQWSGSPQAHFIEFMVASQ